MKLKTILIAGLLVFAGSFAAMAQQKEAGTKTSPKTDSAALSLLKPQKSVTQGTVNVEGKSISYQAVAGTLILKNKDNKPTCSMFYVAYFKSGEDASQRPVTFIYNGGPGSSSLWLHMGAWGPRRVNLNNTAHIQAPYKIVNNDYSLLDVSDLVFIDAPGTGFSRIITKDKGGAGEPKDFYGADPDADVFASFIVQFLSDYNRWDSPKYLFGESYGTFRSAALSSVLEIGKGVSLNGIILLSQILDIANSSDNPGSDPGHDMPFMLALPSYAAVAWYHHKLPNQPKELEPFLKEVEHFAMNDYALALNKGSLLDSVSFNNIAEKLHEYTGLPVAYIKKAGLRIGDLQFGHELLSDEGKVTGRLDARFSGYAINRLGENAVYDPMDSQIDGLFIGAFNNYVRSELKYGKGQTFYPGNGKVYKQWDYRHRVPGFTDPEADIYPNVMSALARAMIYNPKLKVMLNMGYFDLGTPFFEGEYEMHHLPMPRSLQKNISFAHYYSGHMVYLHLPALKKLHDNVAKFIESTH